MKTQMGINTCKSVSFFKFSRTRDWKISHFSWFREFAVPIEKIHLFREIGTSMVYALVGSGVAEVSTGSCNGLLSNRSRLITSHQWGSVATPREQTWVWKVQFYVYFQISQGPMSKNVFCCWWFQIAGELLISCHCTMKWFEASQHLWVLITIAHVDTNTKFGIDSLNLLQVT